MSTKKSGPDTRALDRRCNYIQAKNYNYVN
jgi:hypothetical protein